MSSVKSVICNNFKGTLAASASFADGVIICFVSISHRQSERSTNCEGKILRCVGVRYHRYDCCTSTRNVMILRSFSSFNRDMRWWHHF
jgi:hypothetical protein